MRILTLPLLLAIGVPVAAPAQMMVQPLPGSSDADLLAATMRRVAANPLDVDALLTAGEQSLRVDDLSGAASLFARAEKIDPRNGRVKAGMASILVRSERPGEALRYFAQAAASGLDPRRFAADRGFAYDLTGDQPRAQADYRVALADGADDETMRRYALSLGISGRGDEALRQLAPLLGRSDRAAWRARAFILAMTGDQSGAERIAATMMPAGMADGLRPFFERLPSLPAADRAFAVHFGEVRPTPERIADARLAPALPPLPVEARPVQVAAAAATTPMRAESGGERRRRERNERRAMRERVALAAAQAREQRSRPGRVTLAATVSLPPAAAVVTPPVRVAGLSSPRTAAATLPAAAAVSTPSVQVAAPAPPSVVASSTPTFVTPSPGFIGTAPVAVAMGGQAGPAPGFSAAASSTNLAGPVVANVASSNVPGVVPATNAMGLAPLVASAPMSGVAPAAGTVALTAVGGASSRPDVTPAREPARAPTADSVLARIVASLSIPAAELGVVAPRAQPASGAVSEGAARTAEALRTKAARDAAADGVAQRLVRGRAVEARRGRRDAAEPVALAAVGDALPRTARERRAAVVKADTEAAAVATDDVVVPRTARSRRAAALAAVDADAPAASKRVDVRTARADRKAATEKKAAADRDAEERRASRSHPSRIWVQVSGGANASDLPKAWTATKAKAPQLLGSRAAYSAKLRATNRVVTGPFKTDAEARAFVNQLAKSGVSAFPFTSDAGETVTRLPAK